MCSIQREKKNYTLIGINTKRESKSRVEKELFEMMLKGVSRLWVVRATSPSHSKSEGSQKEICKGIVRLPEVFDCAERILS